MITPVLTQGATTVEVYFPDAIWYMKSHRNCTGTISIRYSEFPIHLSHPISMLQLTLFQSLFAGELFCLFNNQVQ